jgi:hypothetical protein
VIYRPAEENGITGRYQLLKAGCIDFLYPHSVRLRNIVIRVPFLRSGGKKKCSLKITMLSVFSRVSGLNDVAECHEI